MELPQPLQSESPTPVRRFFGGGCRWESPLCAVSERVEQRLGLKKREKREKEKTIDAEPPRRMRCMRQACKHAMAVDDPPLLVLLVPRSARIE